MLSIPSLNTLAPAIELTGVSCATTLGDGANSRLKLYDELDCVIASKSN